ncbi:Alpha/Beta hydrolase protein [Gautieria morchelliformis]|nr:Alpha/Beta hydrolase protein [Gautieria morchelliformis]
MTTPFPFSIALILITLAALASISKGHQYISKDVYLDLVFYFKYASSAYAPICPHPNGQVLVETFNSLIIGTQGYIARDDSRKEIVLALRGSMSPVDLLVDAYVFLIPFDFPGVAAPPGTMVHAGFLSGWKAVAPVVLDSVGVQLQEHSDYNIVTSGHSLGGALASIAAMSLRAKFPFTNISMYTYGQPRTGNSIYANWVNNQFGVRIMHVFIVRHWLRPYPQANAFRVVHTYDGVPTIIPAGKTSLLRNQVVTQSNSLPHYSYRHHGVEYWQNPDPASENTTRRCSADGEDPNCSSAIPSTGINMAHMKYFGILATRPFC